MASNGRLTSKELAPVWCPGVKVYLARADGVAAGWNTMQLYLYDRGIGRVVGNGGDSFYRSFSRQVYWKNYWCSRGKCGNAATPGRSNHGLGNAVDTNQRWKVVRYGEPFGWGSCSDAPWESWHCLRCRGFSRPDPGPDPVYPVLRVGSGGPGQSARVRRLQSYLRKSGWNLPVDGYYGGRTKTAVWQFQQRAGWKTPTGVCAKGTWLRLADVAKNGWKEEEDVPGN